LENDREKKRRRTEDGRGGGAKRGRWGSRRIRKKKEGE
jgi:hypothetical protein